MLIMHKTQFHISFKVGTRMEIGMIITNSTKYYLVLLLLKDSNDSNPGIDFQNKESLITRITE